MSEKWRVFAVLLVAIVLAGIGEALASKGMKQTDPNGGVAAQIQAALGDWHVLVGIALMLGYVALYVYALGLAELSFAVPLSAASYLLGTLLAKFYLHEEVQAARWIGTFVIIAGVLIVAFFGQNKSGSGDGASQSAPERRSQNKTTESAGG